MTAPREDFDVALDRLNQYHALHCESRMSSARCACGLHRIKSELRAAFNRLEDAAPTPAQPKSLSLPLADPFWLIYFYDGDMMPVEVFAGEGAEAAARARYAVARGKWTCRLLTDAAPPARADMDEQMMEFATWFAGTGPFRPSTPADLAEWREARAALRAAPEGGER